MKLNRKWILVMALVLSVALATGGTLAYLTDTKADVNVMTLGSVKIEQHEYQREVGADGKYVTKTIDGQTSYVLEGFEQLKPLLPIVGDPSLSGGDPGYKGWDTTPVRFSQVDSYGGMDVFAGKNAQDKFVTVENTGRSDAYVRTYVAFEAGSVTADKYDKLIDYSFHGVSWKVREDIGIVSINNQNYFVVEFTYAGAELGGDTWRHEGGVLPAGDTSYPNLCQVYMKSKATNEDVEALDGNNNGLFDILVLTQAVQADGFEAVVNDAGETTKTAAQVALEAGFGVANKDNIQKWFGDAGVLPIVNVATAAELQAALDAATNGTMIVLTDDITGDVTVTQKEGVKLTIEGSGKEFAGAITVDGKSARYETAGVTIQNINFEAPSITKDAYINLGVKGDDSTRYTNNVTVSNCTFSYEGEGDAAGIESYTGGDLNLTVKNCTVDESMHSLLQIKNVEQGLTVTNCTVKSKNGINLNSTNSLYMSGCEFDVQGYAVRFGQGGTPLNATTKYHYIYNSILKSACAEADDAVIIFRNDGVNAVVDLSGTKLVGTPEISGNTEKTIIKQAPIYRVSSVNALETALADGGTVVLEQDLDLADKQIEILAGTSATIDLNGNELTGDYDSNGHYAMFTIPDGAELTICGNGEVTANTNATESNRSLALFLNSGKLTISGGTYNVNDTTTGKTWIIATIVDNRTSVASDNALLTINGGDFSVSGNAKNLFRNYPQQGGSATIIFNQGTFHGKPDNEITYIWNQEAGSYPGELYFNGGTYDSNVVYEDYNGQSDIYIADGVTINANSGNN